MKNIFKLFLQVAVASLLILGIWKSYDFYKQNKKSRQLAKKVAIKEEKPFVIVIPSYNNEAYCEKNLTSILTQQYTNYRVIYIDDASTDATYAKVQEIVSHSSLKEKVKVIHNASNQGSLSNLYHTIHTCQDQEIVVIVDGDDFLAHEHVLTKLNRVYSTTPTWMTYGNFLDYPSYKQKPVTCKPFAKNVVFNNSYRSHEWVSSHLRTFYAGLFKQIQEEDLTYKGRFFPMAGDLAFMFPLLEMSGKHTSYVGEILYLYNRTNPLNDHKVNFALQNECANYIRHLPKYKRLKALPFLPQEKKGESV